MDVVPVSGHLGAEIRGVELRSADAAELEAVRDALHRYEVIFFRGANLSPDEHMALAGRLGEINLFPTARLFGGTEPTFQVITDGPDSPPEADYWHTDATWVAIPPKYALLHVEVVPERGGDTLWASMTSVYESLSPELQERLIGLDVVHDGESFITGYRKKAKVFLDDATIEDHITRIRALFPSVTHPLVTTHPDTGRRVLFLGGRFMRGIVGLQPDESDAILDLLRRRVEDPRFHCRWRWQAGDLAIWDERSTNHRSAADHFPQARSIRRVEVASDRAPVPAT